MSCHTMLRYLYIIYLLIYIKCTISYDYYDTNNQGHIRKNGRQYQSNLDNKHKLLIDKDPLTQFNVADFVQNYDDNAADDDAPYAHVKRNEYNDYNSLIETDSRDSDNVQDESQDYLNSGHDSVELNEALPRNEEHSQDLQSMNVLSHMNHRKLEGDKIQEKKYYNDVPANLVHKPEKKCAFKDMKIPFFSHKTSETTKKQKKRKMFSFCNKKVEHNQNKSSNSTDPITKKKRSEEDKLTLCPVCRKKFKNKSYPEVERKKRVNVRNIHNSRQFYAALSDRAKEQSKNKHSSSKFDNTKDFDYNVSTKNIRSKREREEDGKDLRLKEVEEIQKKIDAIDLLNLNKKIEFNKA